MPSTPCLLIQSLKPGTLERIRRAQTLLNKTLHNPPSLPELAKQVKLNEYTFLCDRILSFSRVIIVLIERSLSERRCRAGFRGSFREWRMEG